MLKRTCVTMLLLVGVSAGSVLAADERPERPKRKDRTEALLARIDKALDLNEEKLVQIEQILRTQAQAMKNWHAEHVDDMKALKEAFEAAKKDGDREKLKTLAEKRRKLMAGMMEVRKGLPKALGDVLTAEQVKKVMSLLHPQPQRGGPGEALRHLLGALRRLDLTEDQRAAVKKIMGGLKQAMDQAESPEAKAKITAGAVEKILAVLTDAQREALKKIKASHERRGRRGDPFAGMKLDEEQQTALKKIHADFQAAMKAAKTREEKMAAFKARKEAVEGVLTKEQIEQMRERFRHHRGGDRRKGPRGGDRKPRRKPGGEKPPV